MENPASDDFRRIAPRFAPSNFSRNLGLVSAVEEMAAEKQCSPSQVALAWMLSRGGDVVPIPGTKHVKYLEENAAAVDVELTRSDLGRLERLFPQGAAVGERYPQSGMQAVNR